MGDEDVFQNIKITFKQLQKICSYIRCGFLPTSTVSSAAVWDETLFPPIIYMNSWQKNTVSDKLMFILMGGCSFSLVYWEIHARKWASVQQFLIEPPQLIILWKKHIPNCFLVVCSPKTLKVLVLCVWVQNNVGEWLCVVLTTFICDISLWCLWYSLFIGTTFYWRHSSYENC